MGYSNKTMYGDGESRTRVQRYCHLSIYTCSWYIIFH